MASELTPIPTIFPSSARAPAQRCAPDSARHALCKPTHHIPCENRVAEEWSSLPARTASARRGDLHLVHIQARRAGPNDMQAFRLHHSPPMVCSRHGGIRSRRGIATVEAGTAVGRTRTRRAGAVRFAARPRPKAGYSTGCGADRRKQFCHGEPRHRQKDAHTSPPPPTPNPSMAGSAQPPPFHPTGRLSTAATMTVFVGSHRIAKALQARTTRLGYRSLRVGVEFRKF